MKFERTSTKREIKQIDTSYKISAGEIKKAFDLNGEILSINLYTGRSPNDKEKGKSLNENIWEINTREVKVIKDEEE